MDRSRLPTLLALLLNSFVGSCVDSHDPDQAVVLETTSISEGLHAITRSECTAQLSALGVAHDFNVALPGVPAPVRLLDAGSGVSLVYDVPLGSETTGPLPTSCAAGIALGRAVASVRAEGIAVTRIYHVGSYSPRTIAGSDTPSAHTWALAIDLRGLRVGTQRIVLPDARRDAILASFERNLRASFKLVLGPEYNEDHNKHFHAEQPSGEQASTGFDVVKQPGSDALYVLEGQQLHRIYSLESYLALGQQPIRVLTAAQLAGAQSARSIDGGDEPLVKSPTSPDVYVVRGGQRWLFDDEAAFYACTGAANFAGVFAHATESLLARTPLGGTLYASSCGGPPPPPPVSADDDHDGIANADDLITARGGTQLCLKRATLPAADAGPFVVVGEGLGGWGYPSPNTAQVVGDDLCFTFPTGQFRITWRSATAWAQYATFCSTRHDLFCGRDPSGSYGIGFASQAGQLVPTVGDE